MRNSSSGTMIVLRVIHHPFPVLVTMRWHFAHWTEEHSNDARIQFNSDNLSIEFHRFSLNSVTAAHYPLHTYAFDSGAAIRPTTADVHNWIVNFIFDALLKRTEAIAFRFLSHRNAITLRIHVSSTATMTMIGLPLSYHGKHTPNCCCIRSSWFFRCSVFFIFKLYFCYLT